MDFDDRVMSRATHPLRRRDFIRGVSALAATGAFPAARAQEVPNSSGTDKPTSAVPLGACDCHHHIYDAKRFPGVQPGGAMIADARVEEFLLLRKRLGITRNVIVTPRVYVTDNTVTLDAIERIGSNARGIAVVHPSVTDVELKRLVAGGIRGIRFSLDDPRVAVTTIDMVEPLARRVAPLGLHVQINMQADGIADNASLWDQLPCQLVFDHMGHIPPPHGRNHRAFAVLRRLLDKGNTWVKLSVTYTNTKDGPPAYDDVSALARAFVATAPERLVWGTNWPHPNEKVKPNPALLLDLVARWVPDEEARTRILVRNPEKLYGFPAVTALAR